MPENDNHFVEDWLGQPVRPIPPPPGTFERIRKRARRRKITRAAASGAALAAVLVIAVVIPRAIAPVLGQHPGQNAAAADHTPVTRHNPAPRPSGGGPPTATPTTSSGLPPVPAGFRVSSVTFVGQQTGWVLGQAGAAGQCTGPNPADCTSIARTDTAGASWYGVPAPVTGAPHGGAGVSQLRFADTDNGWAFGPELWATHDGGADTPGGGPGSGWTKISTGGKRVLALEAVNGRAFSVWARCSGTGADYAAGCTRFWLYTAAEGSDHWTLVSGTTSVGSTATGSAVQLVLTGSTGYLLTPGGRLLSGPVNGGFWHVVLHKDAVVALPCAAGLPQGGGTSALPSQALLAGTGTKGLLLVCPGVSQASSLFNALYYSQDGGAVWQARGNVPGTGTVTSLSGSPAGAIVAATTNGIETSASPGSTWTTAVNASPRGGFTYVGMTLATQGVAVAADQRLHELWFTTQSATNWVTQPIR